MHPNLPEDVAVSILGRAALALQRNSHASGVGVAILVERAASQGRLMWDKYDEATADQHDDNRVTEDGAEAISLAVAHLSEGWRVVRRMQREEFADWLLEHRDEEKRKIIALEVSGTDHGPTASRLKKKLKQVQGCADVDQRWPCVVGFKLPDVLLDRALPVRPSSSK